MKRRCRIAFSVQCPSIDEKRRTVCRRLTLTVRRDRTRRRNTRLSSARRTCSSRDAVTTNACLNRMFFFCAISRSMLDDDDDVTVWSQSILDTVKSDRKAFVLRRSFRPIVHFGTDGGRSENPFDARQRKLIQVRSTVLPNAAASLMRFNFFNVQRRLSAANCVFVCVRVMSVIKAQYHKLSYIAVVTVFILAKYRLLITILFALVLTIVLLQRSD